MDQVQREYVQGKLSSLRTVIGVFGDGFLVAVAISAAVGTAVILGTSFATGF